MGERAGGNAAGRGGGLQARRDLDGIASQKAPARAGFDIEAHQGLTGVDADADAEGRTVGTQSFPSSPR